MKGSVSKQLLFIPKMHDYMIKVKSKAIDVETRTFVIIEQVRSPCSPVQAIYICIYIAAHSE